MRLPLTCFACLSILAGSSPQKPVIVVITISGVEAYSQAVAGMREQYPDLQVWDALDETRLIEKFARFQPALAIAVGGTAAAAADHVSPPQVALVNSVALTFDLENGRPRTSRFKTTVTVDMPPDMLLLEVVRVFPGRSRIGMIRGPMQSDAYVKAFEQAARRNGLTVETVTCIHPRDLVEAFLTLRSRADLVWCPPNSQLYNSATLKPLLIASLTNRLPILAFSEQFVQAGAVFGGFADFTDVGRQTALIATRVLRNESVPAVEGARKFRFSYNQKVARLLGLKAVTNDPSDDLVVIR